MNFSRYFLLADGRLRAGWRLMIFAGLYVLAANLSALLFYEPLGGRLLVFNAVVQATATLAATWLMLRAFDRRPLWSVGIQPERRAWRSLGHGFAVGFVMAEVVILTAAAAGWVALEQTGVANMEAAALTGAFIFLLVSATAEEMLFRGYPFQRLVEGGSGLAAIAITSALFGLLHGRNPEATTLGVLNTMLAGVLFSVAYLKTGALWLPIGIHFAWNWALAVSGFPVSGLSVLEMPWRAVPTSSTTWLYGGQYGPEGGILATGALLAGIAYLCFRLPGWKGKPPNNSAAGKVRTP